MHDAATHREPDPSPEPSREAGPVTVTEISAAPIPTRHGHFVAHAFHSDHDDHEHLAMVFGEPRPGIALVRLHSECITGDVFGSLRCDCGTQLDAALSAVAAAGWGAVVYLRGHEGRGIGLARKLAAYRLQDEGLDTVDANLALGLPADGRDYAVGSAILGALGMPAVRLLTNNPGKETGLELHGITVVERVPLFGETTVENTAYLATKRDRMGHLLG